MTPQEFVDKWRASKLTERAASQSHFKDLCRLLGVVEPYEDDPSDADYAFEKGATKTGGGDGWADVWKRGCFGWEYKGKRKNLDEALKQLKLYQGALNNPPLLIVSDMERIEVHTSWTNMVQETHVFALDDLLDARIRERLKTAFSETAVEAFRPGRKRADLTKEVAEKFVELAQSLRARDHTPEAVAHFVNRMVFCMFAEDVDLLPDKLFTRLLERSLADSERFGDRAARLFSQMKAGGEIDYAKIEWFNGGLFDDDVALPLQKADIQLALNAAKQDWSSIDPSIMGTLFERGLDPGKRSQLGAHYTDPDKIMLIVNPVIVEPLGREWEAAKSAILAEMEKSALARSAGAKTQAYNRAKEIKTKFLERLKAFRILDPACGSGNFLFLGLKALKDIEHRANIEGEKLGLPRDFPAVGPENMLGIEINPFAAELARVSVWIGEIQWMREHGFDVTRNPILRSLDTIVRHDALLNEDGSEYQWPAADAIIGNPPFLGGKLLRDGLGDEAVEQMFAVFRGRVPAEADLVCYWFAKAREQMESGAASRVGLVSTNSIRGGANREVLDAVEEVGRIFNAWSDEPWVVDGAAVRVSIVCFDNEGGEDGLRLDDEPTERINTDLSASVTNATKSDRLDSNLGIAFMGYTKGGAFDISGEQARSWLKAPKNPNGRSNSDVLRPWANAYDLTNRSREMWLIDFGVELNEVASALFESPFQHLQEHVQTSRQCLKRESYRRLWWRHVEPRPTLRKRSAGLTRLLVTPRVAKHRTFVWLDPAVAPDSRLFVFVREDETFAGILHSHLHEVWSLATCSWHGVGNDPTYNASTCFETFPFPEGLTPNIPAADYADDPCAQAIAAAAKRLNELRENWLNPEDLVRREPEVVPGYPDRILPINDEAAKELKKRTLTNLYNLRPAWLDHAHRDLDAAVAAAYGWADWGAGLADEVILERLFALNQERAVQGR